MVTPRSTLVGLTRLQGTTLGAGPHGSDLWHYTEKAKKRTKDERTCVECGAILCSYNPQTSCWSHDYEDVTA